MCARERKRVSRERVCERERKKRVSEREKEREKEKKKERVRVHPSHFRQSDFQFSILSGQKRIFLIVQSFY